MKKPWFLQLYFLMMVVAVNSLNLSKISRITKWFETLGYGTFYPLSTLVVHFKGFAKILYSFCFFKLNKVL